MYAIKCLGGLDPYFLQLPEENSDGEVPQRSYYDVTRDVSQATTETTIPALLGRLERFAKQRYATDQQMTIVRVISTPGTATRREVPLGTPGSKVAVRNEEGGFFLRARRSEFVNFSLDIDAAALFDAKKDAMKVLWSLHPSVGFSTLVPEFVGILESTTEPTLTTEEVR